MHASKVQRPCKAFIDKRATEGGDHRTRSKQVYGPMSADMAEVFA